MPNATLIPHIQNKELLTVIRVPVTDLSIAMQYIELNKWCNVIFIIMLMFCIRTPI